MRVDRVLKQYKPVLDYKEKENVYKQIIKDYSAVSISASDFAVLMDVKWNTKYVPEKITSEMIIRPTAVKIAIDVNTSLFTAVMEVT